jgi:hypothetical protein
MAWEHSGKIGVGGWTWSEDHFRQTLYTQGLNSAKFQHPVLALNKDGDTIVVVAEGTGWNRGGALHWWIENKKGVTGGQRADAIPVWGLPAVIAEPNGDFTILH